jgi:hypothetical protein
MGASLGLMDEQILRMLGRIFGSKGKEMIRL